MSLGQWAACATTAVVIAGSLVVYTGYRDVLGIETADVDPDGWGDRPAQVEGLHNILLLGTDERAGDDASYNELNGVRPDVLVVVSIDVDQGGVTMVNLPRDTMVEIPPCDPGEGGAGWSGGVDQLNHAMTYGGMDCQGNAVETITGIHLDHMVLVDFAGFEHIVDSIGGIEMCVPEPIDDPKAHIRLDAGEQRLDGEQALGLARSRDSAANGSDLGRIENQQRMMGAILREVTSGDILSSPSNLVSFLDSVTDSLVTDNGLTIDKMTELAVAMREVDLGRMTMLTAPVEDYQADNNKVQLREPDAQHLFTSVAAGELIEEEGGSEDSEGPEDDGSDGEADPSDVPVVLLNNTGLDGLGAQVEPLLTAEGFTVADTTNPELRAPDATTVYHGPEHAENAELLASALENGAEIVEEPSLSEEMELVMGGADWAGVAGLGAGGSGGGDADLDDLGGTSAAEDEVSCG
ncbi:LCP family protein [Nocardiopsis sp. MG754419]|uniref:LCP family protein n=1 Tax=Nocardiopsis sp. MG754419 TaxID=2259865 RepID=UPI001BAB0CAD|nr:LCP family protein [Nocardiopsis sp. MG754419]